MSPVAFTFFGLRFIHRSHLPPSIQITNVLGSLFISLFLIMLLFSFMGIPSLEALRVLWWQPLVQSRYEISLVLSILILCSLGAAFCFRARLINLGGQGVFLTAVYCTSYGAIYGATYGTSNALTELPLVFGPTGEWALFGLVGMVSIVSMMSIFSSIVWMTLLALLFERAPRYLAHGSIILALLTDAVIGALVGKGSAVVPSSLFSALLPPTTPMLTSAVPTTASTAVNTAVPTLPSFLLGDWELASALPVALILVAIYAWGMAQTTWGFRFKVRTESIGAGQYAGLSDRTATWIALLVSAVFTGIAGALYVLSTPLLWGPSLSFSPLLPHALTTSLGASHHLLLWEYGWAAMMVAWMGRNHPVGVMVLSLVFAVLMLGCRTAIQMWHLPDNLPLLCMGLILGVFLTLDALMRFQIDEEEER